MRDHAPRTEGPFYAEKVYAGDIGTAVGIAWNENAQALDGVGKPIAGLHGAANDMHAVMGGEYLASGITMWPALTVGWLAGWHAAHANGRRCSASGRSERHPWLKPRERSPRPSRYCCSTWALTAMRFHNWISAAWNARISSGPPCITSAPLRS
jgi:hypothetical protein